MESSFQKYTEVEIHHDTVNSNLSIRAPWMSLEFETEKENEDKIKNALSAVEKSSSGLFLDETEQSAIDWLFSFMQEFPVANRLPRKDLPQSQFAHQVNSDIKKLLSMLPEDALKMIGGSSMQLKSNDWSWSVENILNRSRVSDGIFDPLTLFTQLRHERLKAENEASHNFSWYEILETIRLENEDLFFSVCKFSMRQTHYVTNKCVSCLYPAVDTFVEATDLVKEFIREEQGHDRLVWKSLAALGVESLENIPLLDETKMSMDILKFSAENSPISFACLVSIFESSGHAEKDPLAFLLEKSSIPEAADGLQIHFEINRDHKHACVGENMLATMGAISKEQAIVAIRLSELLVILGNELSMRLQEKVLSLKKVI